MSVAELTLEVEQGIPFRKTLTWKTGATPVPVDLTGCTARMQVRERIGSPLALLTLTTSNGGLELGGSTGAITIVITEAQTQLLTKKTALYSLRIRFLDGTVRRLVAGSIVLSLDVTHD